MPVTWEELKKALKKRDPSLLFFGPEAALKRLKKTGDLFAPVLKVEQKLPQPFLDLQLPPRRSPKTRRLRRLKPTAKTRHKNARRGLALTAAAMKHCRWLKPKLVAQIEFTEWTDGDRLRHSRFVGLREDKNPKEVRREIAA